MKHSSVSFHTPRAEQSAWYTLAQENMQVDLNECHFVATCWLNNGGTTNRSRQRTWSIKCEGGGKLEPKVLGLTKDLYKEDEYTL